MTKADLKTGMIVEMRKGEQYLVMLNSGIKNFCDYTVNLISLEEGWTSLEFYNDDLTHEGGDIKWDIVKVSETDLSIQYMFSDVSLMIEDLTTIWERKDESVEMTISEIEQKLGIKNLKIKGEN